jgi:octaprenyl-diphosphate synthase
MTEGTFSLPTGSTAAQRELAAELAEVEQLLLDAMGELFPPFRQMVATQLRYNYPLHRAAVVLTTGVAAPDQAIVRSQRIYLAAALEMLHLALSVHIMMSDTAAQDPANRSLLGSTILAGDYCFSRSAGLAVRTGNATVVEIFSDALKRVSEGHLRQLFAPTSTTYNEDRELFIAGAQAAMELANTPARTRREVLALVEEFAQTLSAPGARTALQMAPDSLLDHYQRERWQALQQWRYDT